HLRYKQQPLVLRNRKGSFEPYDVLTGGPAWAGRGVAIGDIDNDGDTDIVVSNLGERAYVLRNEGGNRANWLGLSLRGKKSNRDGIGARIRVATSESQIQWYEVTTGGSYLSAGDRRVLVGLGDRATAEIEIYWPSGFVQRLPKMKSRQWVAVQEPDR
ncbi:MAG: CRTAC1 family protein, partial [Bryobacteraceae bacterium]|nr:CRTAC1 family protein [Bryobacteraceae bacterium]